MAKDYKTKVALDITDWKTGVSTLKRDNIVIESGFKAVSAGLDDWKTSAEGLSSRQDALNKKIQNQSKIVSLLEKEYKNVADEYGATSKEAQNFLVKLNREKAALAGNEKALKNVSEKLKKVKNRTGEYIQKLKKVGNVAKTAFKGIVAGVAVAGVAIYQAGKKIVGMANDTAETGDEIDKLSQKMGLSREGFQELKYVAGQYGTSVESLQTGMGKFIKKLDDAKSGGEATNEMFETLGVNPNQFSSTEEAFNAVIAQMQAMEDGTEKEALALELFGTAGKELMPMLNGTAEDVENLKNKAHELGIIMSDEAVDAAVAYSDSVDTLKSSFKGLKDSAVANILPGLTQITDGLTGVLNGTEGAENQMAEGANAIVSSLASFIPGIITIITSIVSAIATVAPDIIRALADGILTVLPDLLTMLSEIIPILVEVVVMALPMILTAITEIIPVLVEAILGALPMIIEAILGALPSLINMVIQIVTAIITMLPTIIPQLIAAVMKAIPAIIKALIGAIPQLISAGVELFLALIENMPLIITEIVKAIPDIIIALVTGFKEYFSEMSGIGRRLIEGIWEGIKNAANWIKDKIMGFVENILGVFNIGFDIHSPSKETMWTGEMIGEGIGAGILSSLGYVLNQTEKMKNEVMSSLSFADHALQLSPAIAGNTTYDYSKTQHIDVNWQAGSKNDESASLEKFKNDIRKAFK